MKPIEPAIPALGRNALEPIRPRNVSKRFSILAERYGQPGVRFHDLRHTHASIQSLPACQSTRLRIASGNITLAVYGHLFKRSED